MSVEIRVASIDPIRQTFARTARRFGADKPASRYQEASFDLQPRDNFHYRPVWDPQRDIYDRGRTAIVMADWDEFRDPRQFYYATYVINRARMQESAEKNFEFVDKNGLMAGLPATTRQELDSILLPLRHVEWAANLNNCFIAAYCYGSPMAQGAMYNTNDRLGIAQYLSRIGLLIDGNSGQSLAAAKESWLHDPAWQPLRRLLEHCLVQKDWFEVLVAQNLVLDGLIHPLLHARFQARAGEAGSAILGMLTDFIREWFAENVKWVDASLKVAAAESADNRRLLAGWAASWTARAAEALAPIAARFSDGSGDAHLAAVRAALDERIRKLGLAQA
ncbi:aromatic/alkene monooxygenase hydroxylase subunit beta [Zoogloea sp.]|uniref:aromatic/alkene monooxygenase hydroxylase subunit beta n=1 Tax=Zoogloea sp. TaxID=49181 RepID=UPI001AC8E054|nr:aromatic/alkene monooxygenase hydroxylase subunit beta [Zoogloea sp.]MBN8283647.1 aromatic/alkene monooxygenase hydroxylase subunit beta [Zoogloea sp.]